MNSIKEPNHQAQYMSWLGRTQVAEDDITAAPLRGLSATLGRQDPPVETGTLLPPLWHWLFFPSLHRPDQMRPDGHVAGGGFMPPVPLPRRMWAGSEFTWDNHNPIRVGNRIRRESRIESITHKKEGELIFVRLIHDYYNESGLSFSNVHDSAFRSAAKPDAPKTSPITGDTACDWQRDIVPDAVLLFRYSALTFNPHRIHYDNKYATEVEKYPTILVQGPLNATLLMDLVRRELPDAKVKKLQFKAIRPAFEGRALSLRAKIEGNSVKLWSQDDEGYVTMNASAELE